VKHITEYVKFKKICYFIVDTEFNLFLCKVWGFNGGDYEEWRLLGCYAVWLL
jgi:hypothetical protein